MTFRTLHLQQAGRRAPHNRARISIKLVVVLGVVVLLFVGGIIAAYVLLKDEPPPDVEDLYVRRQEIPEEENAFHYLELARAKMYWPERGDAAANPFVQAVKEGKTTFTQEDLDRFLEAEKTREKSKTERLRDMLEGEEEWDPILAAEFLENNKEMLALFDRALDCSRCQVPKVISVEQELDYLSPWRDMARLAAVRAIRDLREGREQEAFEGAIDILRFGHMIEDSGGCMMNWLVGNAVARLGLQTTRRLLAETTLPPEELRPSVERVGAYESRREGLINAYRAEYEVFSNAVDDVAKGKGGPYGAMAKRGLSRFVFKPNQTRRMYAEHLRWVIKDAKRSRWEWQADVPEDMEWLLDLETKGSTPWRIRNHVGRVLVAMIAPPLSRANIEACRTDWCARATKVMIALRSYVSKTGELPDDLEALVPDYLDEVPTDPFDGQPLRYSREEGILYASDEEFRGREGSFDIPSWTEEREKEGEASETVPH